MALCHGIADFYDRNGDNILKSQANSYVSRYDNLANLATIAYVESAIMPPQQGETATFLDLCCGTGISSIYPAKLGYQVWGVDVSPKSTEAAQLFAKMNGVEQACHFEVSEAVAYLRATQLSFGMIFVWGGLYYLDLTEALPLIYDRLKRDGVFMCVETNGSNFIMNVVRCIRSRIRKHRDDSTLKNLLRTRDYRDIAGYFDSFEIQLFYFFALASVAFMEHSFGHSFSQIRCESRSFPTQCIRASILVI
jgi:SAM-dependent methyltransferase